MSRFRTGSPRKPVGDTTYNFTPEYEKPPVSRLRYEDEEGRGHVSLDSASLKRLFNDSQGDVEEEDTSISHTPLKGRTGSSLLKRLAMLAAGDTSQHDQHHDIMSVDGAESYVSHTSKSIQETSALLQEAENQDTHELQASLWSQSRSINPNTSALHAQVEAETSLRLDKSIKSPMISSSVPSTPMNASQRGLEVAEGYISPPESRRTSPKYEPNESYQKPTVPPLFRRVNSPSPVAMRRLTTDSSSGDHSTAIPGSPRSRLTRTLIEIQQELASSREGIEDIDARLGVLEQHASLTPDQMQKHVQDCIRSVLIESEQSSEPDLDAHNNLADDASVDDTIDANQAETRVEVETWPGTFALRACIIGCVGALVVEYAVMSLLNELGRRHSLFTS